MFQEEQRQSDEVPMHLFTQYSFSEEGGTFTLSVKMDADGVLRKPKEVSMVIELAIANGTLKIEDKAFQSNSIRKVKIFFF